MNASLPSTLPFLSASYLNAWAPHPISGSLAGPRPPVETECGKYGRRLLWDGPQAEFVVASSARVLRDCADFVEGLKSSSCPLPQPLPRPAAGWMIKSFQGNSASFEQAEEPKRVAIDLRSDGRAFFEVGLAGGDREINQKVSIDVNTHVVTTESYYFHTRFKTLAKAADFAALVSTLIYDSGQYDVETELGPLMVRDPLTGRETAMERKGDRFSFTGQTSLFPDELLLASAASVFATPDPRYREPVVSVSISPLKLDEPSSATILLYRPPERKTTRMPLKERLRRVLWEPLGRKIKT